MSRFWLVGWLGGARPSADSGCLAGWGARAHQPILADSLAGGRAPISRFWLVGWLGGARPSADSGLLAGCSGARPSADLGWLAGCGARAHQPILTGWLAGGRVPISRF